MGVIPRDSFSIHTAKSRDQVLRAVYENTQPQQYLSRFGRPPEKRFWGRVYTDGFEVHPALRRRSGFLPVVRGSFGPPQRYGALVNVEMRLRPFAAGFMVFWLLFCAILFAAFAAFTILFPEIWDYDILLCLAFPLAPLLVLFAGYGMMRGEFKRQGKKVRKRLTALIGGEVDHPG